MKELLLQYAEYNVWANKRLIDLLLKQEEGLCDKEVASSFTTIRATIMHNWSAEVIWLQRLELAEHPQWMESIFTGTLTEAFQQWQNTSAELVKFIAKQYDDRSFTHEVIFPDRRGDISKMQVGQILHHVFNHATYHRGQIVTMLRTLGVKDIPSTDFFAFARKK